MTWSTSGTCSTWRGRRWPRSGICLALIHLVQVIGEAARQVSRDFTVTHPEVPWENIIGMRHKVVHDYLGVDEDIVWQVVTGDLPKLVESLEPLVPRTP